MKANEIKASLFATSNDKKKIYIKETKSTIYISKINVAQTDKISKLEKEKKEVDGLVYLVIENCYDEDNNKLFTIDDWDNLNKLPFKILRQIVDEIRRFSLNDEDNEDEDDEDLKKK